MLRCSLIYIPSAYSSQIILNLWYLVLNKSELLQSLELHTFIAINNAKENMKITKSVMFGIEEQIFR